jgi:hypothetical protein
VRVVLALARRDLVAFYRRRESFWVFMAFGLLCVSPLALATASGARWLEFWPTLGEAAVAEILHNYAAVVECVALVVLAFALSNRLLGQEIQDGSWLLLRLTPAPVGQILLGRAIGVALVLTGVHGFSTSLLLFTTPLLRRTHVEVWTTAIGVLLVAFAAIPEGFAQAALAPASRGGPLVFRMITGVRLTLVLTVVGLAFGRRDEEAVSFGRTIERWLFLPAQGPAPVAKATDPLLPWLLLLSWLGLSGVALWVFVLRRWRS